ncbi:hypothetical protein FACS1894141_3780 [Spirochaetia bacterium]|nr:hypothetical protein FACS1894141_3780 [Spirochaetia bacterium]
MPELTKQNIELIILFVAPGFISLKVWGLIHANLRLRISESLIEAVIYSSWNAVFFLGLFEVLNTMSPILAYAVVFICLPVIWPILVNNIAHSEPQRLQNGYTPKGYVTQVVQGRTVQIPVSQVTILPPTSGTAAVTPKK